MSLPRFSLALVMAAAMALPIAAQTPQSVLTPPPPMAPRNADGSVQTEPQFIAQRIYRALLGREADPPVMAEAALDIERGRLRQRVNAIVISSEFRSHMYGWPPDRILAQIYQGLLERDPDAGAANWQRLIAMAKYADVIGGLIATPEFKAKLAPFAPPPAAATATGAANEVPAAVVCQESVLDAIRKDFSGVVFIQFDAAAIDGATITGAATDVNGGGRRLTYRCDPAPSYKYDDGVRERRTGATEFANDVVGACQREISIKAQQDFAVARLTFLSAGLMAAGTSGQLVRGSAAERMPSGVLSNFSYSCDMDGTQVTSSSLRR